MKCPKCGAGKTKVIRTSGTLRRRACKCGHRWSTQEVEVGAKHMPMATRHAPKEKPHTEVRERPARSRIEDLNDARSLGLSIDADGWGKSWED